MHKISKQPDPRAGRLNDKVRHERGKGLYVGKLFDAVLRGR
jgi:hypothetical protein